MQKWNSTSLGDSGWLEGVSLSRKMRLDWEYGKSPSATGTNIHCQVEEDC